LLQRCIDEGLSVDIIDTNTQLTLLHHAVVNNDADIAEYLLERYITNKLMLSVSFSTGVLHLKQ